MPLPFDFDVNDLILVARAVKSCYRDCREAGKAYREISHLVWCLDSVLSTIEASLSQRESLLVHAGEGKRQLAESIRGCEAIIDEVVSLLENYGRLDERRGSRSVRRVWDRARFSIREFGQRVHAIRGRLAAGIMTIMLQLDALQIFATAEAPNTLDVTRRQMRDGIEGNRTTIRDVAVRLGRIDASGGDEMDDRNEEMEAGWRKVKDELRGLGFSKEEVRWSKKIIVAYLRERTMALPLLLSVPRNNQAASQSRGSAESVRSRGRRRVRTRPRTSMPRSQIGGAPSIPSSPPPSYASRAQSSRSDSSSTLVPSSPGSEARPPPYTAYPDHGPNTTTSQQRSGINPGHMLLLGLAIASVSYIAVNHYKRRRRRGLR
jgi:hypothetical protein